MPARDPESRPLGWPRDILIFGIGALGLRLAGSLLLDATDAASATDAAGTAPPPSVALAGTWPEGLAALRANGLGLIDAAGNEARIHLPVYERTGDLPRADLVIVAVKQHQISAVAPAVRRAVRPDGLVLTLQNGLGADAILASHVGAERVAVGVTSAGAALVEPGVVRLAGAGETLIGAAQPGSRPGSSRPNATAPKAIGAGAGEPRILGPRRGPEEGRLSGAPVEVGGSDAASLARLEAIATILTSVGLPTRRVDDIRVAQWRKLAVNAAINGVTAVIRRPNGFLLDSTPARQLALEAARETARVARAVGIAWHGDPAALMDRVARDTATNRSSMLQDSLNGRPTETDAIHGAVVEAGRQVGIATPVNLWLWSAVRENLCVTPEALPAVAEAAALPAGPA